MKMATVYVYGASIDENGKAHGGKAGNQTGRELRKQKWYEHGKGWRVFRAKNPSVATKIAQCAKAAVANRHIGYDQYQRNTLYNEAVKYGFDVSKVTKDVETDCSALVRVCCAFAGVTGLPAEFRTTNEPALLLKTGAFTELVGDQYTKQSAYLRAGDILCTKTQGHTVVVGNDGAKAEAQTPADLPEPQGLSRGDHGSAVETMQRLLLKWDAACLPKYGADGDFGGETENAVRTFQLDHGLLPDGVMQQDDFAALFAALDGNTPAPSEQTVEITGDTVNVRNAPGTTGTRVIGIARKGDKLVYQGQTDNSSGRDWYLVEYKNENGWVSSKYARVI